MGRAGSAEGRGGAKASAHYTFLKVMPQPRAEHRAGQPPLAGSGQWGSLGPPKPDFSWDPFLLVHVYRIMFKMNLQMVAPLSPQNPASEERAGGCHSILQTPN
jgi:hypothetical protein